MRTLYLVRHATPAIHPETPARDWTLSERGVTEAQALAGRAEGWGIEAVYSSSEAKARATALVIGDALGLPVHVVAAFDELRMPEWISNADEFNEAVRTVLTGANDAHIPLLEPLLDSRHAERASIAAGRFAEGVGIVEQAALPAAIVSHGRILTAFLTQLCGIEEPFEFWRSIPMPGWTSVDLDAPANRAPTFMS
ncbi:MAG TPA: histidine phosphatase family protein [Dehalococcoidia bacterium]|jgi:broad specificity phosphatase PhoE